ncbi:MarR family winged helix-turn-helix transcriptional regulator [Rhodoferax sp.]|uniref:MarR family winged helix-turn-helix transcriptional regulator n=1 Tax=Rhodoferax sp. TaxID=50421 RepID=UPI002ACD66F4|nr:MarR family transcriptional regulator [Rhodoferax sp.]MDZ7921950.1 MarR family transcriptional regulator [Rhodoferax sp.]
MRDIVKELGFLTLGTRFKRIGDLLQAQTQELLSKNGMELPAAHYPLLAALDQLGPLGVSELSRAVGVSQPVVSRSLLGLVESGLVESKSVTTDQRMRRIQLSRKGRERVKYAKQAVWPLIEAAVAQVCEPLNGSLLEQLATLEIALEMLSLQQRASNFAPAALVSTQRTST